MLAQLGPARPAGGASAAGGGGLAARPSLQAAPQDFATVWGRVAGLVDELLSNPLRKPELHLMTGHQLVYRIAGGSCTSYPADVQRIVDKYQAEQQATAGPASARSATGPHTGQTRSPYSMLLRDLLSDHIRRHVTRVREASLKPLTGRPLLAAYVNAWKHFGFSLAAISSVFSYAHTSWYPTRQRGDGARVLGEQIWRDALYDGVKNPLIRACLDSIAEDRDGSPVERHVVRDVVESFTRLSGQPAQPLLLYQAHLESNYLRKLEDFLRRALLRCRDDANGSPADELRATVRVLQSEVDRASKMLHSSTGRPLMRLITSDIPSNDLRRIFGEVRVWAAAGDGAAGPLSDLYWLARHTDGGYDLLADTFAAAVEHTGRAALDASQGPVWFVHAANSAITKAEHIVNRYFDGNRRVLGRVRESFGAIVNDNAHTRASQLAAPELLASFTHIALRPGSGQAQADMLSAFHGFDASSDAIVMLLRYLSDRDVFQVLYAKHLCSRILAGVCTLEDEHAMISAIAAVVTQNDFCYKWRRMLTDVERSNELRQALAASSTDADSSAATVDFRPLVATQGTWPLSPDEARTAPIVLPPAIDAAGQAFSRFFLSRAGERKRLVWVHGQASAVLRPCFTKRKHDITVSFAQACLLVGPEYAAPPGTPGSMITAAAVARWCGVDADSLVRPLAVLERLKIVRFAAPLAAGTPVRPGTVYEINIAFNASAQKINAQSARDVAPPPVAPGAQVTKDADSARVIEDRKFAVQAAIVRVCKSRKSVRFQELVAEVVKILQQTVFTPSVALVKTNIETLIDKEYLERSPDDHESIDYLA